MREAHGVDAHFEHDRHVFVVMLFRERVPDAVAVLVAADAAQRQALAVQEKALVGIDAEETQAERLLHAVDFLAAAQQDDFGAVQERIFAAVPQARIFHVELDFRPGGGVRGNGDRAVFFLHDFSVGENARADADVRGNVGAVGKRRDDADGRLTRRR